jgi:hypothetical protein
MSSFSTPYYPNRGEMDSAGGDTIWTWDMLHDGIVVRIALETKPAKKTDVKVVVGANTLKVEIFGDTVIEGKLAGTVHSNKSTWDLIENGDELEIMLTSTTSTPWRSLFDSSGPVPVMAPMF